MTKQRDCIMEEELYLLVKQLAKLKKKRKSCYGKIQGTSSYSTTQIENLVKKAKKLLQSQ